MPVGAFNAVDRAPIIVPIPVPRIAHYAVTKPAMIRQTPITASAATMANATTNCASDCGFIGWLS